MNFISAIPAILGFFLLACAYAAQYWAYRSFRELKKINDRLDRQPPAPRL